LVSSYIEPETVWPNIKSDVEFHDGAASPKVVPSQDKLQQPNFRAGKLVLIFKRPS
jgi:hypothetical protein